MKIIHTSDWHLGHRLYNYDRTDEELHLFGLLCELVEREKPDALVISGDVFHTGAPGNDVAKEFTDGLLSVAAQCPTMETVVIAGNHDSYSRLVVDAALWERCHVHVFGVPAEDANGGADFDKNIVTVGDKGVIAAVPFCHARNFPAVADATGDNRQKDYFAALAKHLEKAAGDRPAILMAHLAVKGELDLRGHDSSLVIGGEECVAATDLGAAYDYVALGHIHCPQWVKGISKTARYCGTPRAIHFDETYPHGVDIVTVEHGKEPTVETRIFNPLHALLTIGGDKGSDFATATKELAQASPDEETYVRLNVRIGANESIGADWNELARKACAERNLRFCVINPIRDEGTETADAVRRKLTTAELKELSDDEVLTILSSRHEMSERQRELVGGLLRDLAAEVKM